MASGKTAIVGIASTSYTKLYRAPEPDLTIEQLGIGVLQAALDDAGLNISQIDGLITSAFPYYPSFAYRAGLRDVRFLMSYPMSGRMCAVALDHASLVVQARQADYVALVYATDQRSAKVPYGRSDYPGEMYELAYGLTSPGAYYAMAYSQYLHRYGYEKREELLGAVSVGIRRHASMNPDAVFQRPLTLAEYMQARYIARPLRLFDYCVPCDGAVCYIVTTVERARDLRKPPAVIAGVVERAALRESFVPEDLWFSACQDMAKRLLGSTGQKVNEVSSLQVYDNFSVAVPWALEGFGWCKRGEALQWLQDGRIEVGGELPVNTSGGMLSEAYLQGWNHHVEAVRQLRHEAGQRQVTDCRSVLYACLAPVCSATLLVRDEKLRS